MNDAFICDAIRTPFGRYGGVLKDVRADDLGAVPIKALIERNPGVDWRALGDVILCPQVVGVAWRAPLTHGLLHLLGYDHGAAMEEREQALLP